MNITGKPGRPLIIAHRGFSATHLENSREAFEAAIASRADLIETDVRLSCDGTLYCSHDPHLERTHGTDKTIAGLSDDSLDALGVLRLEEALRIVRGKAGMLLDLKLLFAEYSVTALEAVRRSRMEEAVAFGVRTVPQAVALRREDPHLTIVGLFKTLEEIAAFRRAGGSVTRLWEEDVSERSLSEVRRGRGVVWITSGLTRHGEPAGQINAARLTKLAHLGVNGVLVNDPAAALEAFDSAVPAMR